MDSKEYWNEVSDRKQFTTPFQAELFTQYVKKDSTILDVGCGYGRILHELSKLGYEKLIGIDFSQGMIERGKREFPDFDLRVKKDSAIDLENNSVDAVILFAVLTCIVSDEEQKELIAEIKRALKPGGILYINDFLLNTDKRNLARYERYKDKYGLYGIFELPEGAVMRHHDEHWIENLLNEFVRLEYERLTFITMNGHESNGFYYFGKE